MKKTICLALLLCLIPSLAQAEGYYFHEDYLGGSSIVTDEEGNVVAEYDYMPFGELYQETIYDEDFSNSYKFTDQEEDAETGLYYYGARYYGAGVGRFTSQDPAVYDERLFENLDDPQSLNTYAYVRNNPVKFTDPSGEFWDVVWDIANYVFDYFTGDTDDMAIDLIAATIPGIPSVANVDDVVDITKTITSKAGDVKKAVVKMADDFVASINTKIDDIAKSSDSIACNSVRDFTFGHGARHLNGTGLSQEAVENTIKNDIDLNVDTSIEGFFTGQVKVDEQIVEYRAYNRDGDITHVGTYYVKDN